MNIDKFPTQKIHANAVLHQFMWKLNKMLPEQHLFCLAFRETSKCDNVKMSKWTSSDNAEFRITKIP